MCINEIIPGQRRITAESAIAFSKVFEIEPLFWLNLQRDYDLALEANKSQAPVRSISRTILRRHIILTVPIGPNGSVDAMRQQFGDHGHQAIFGKFRSSADSASTRSADLVHESPHKACTHLSSYTKIPPCLAELKMARGKKITSVYADVATLRDFVSKTIAEPPAPKNPSAPSLASLIESDSNRYRSVVNLLAQGHSIQAVSSATGVDLALVKAASWFVPDYPIICKNATAKI
jgi:hypothetical protein